MTIWLDAQLSPTLANWIAASFGVSRAAVRDLGLRDAFDREIFSAARQAEAIVMTKDSDFAFLIERYGPPPQILLLRCGNTSNAYLKDLLRRALPQALALVQSGEPLVEISEPRRKV
jgi:predicted nuclease of predicted toxin-antitoxin system